MASGEADLASCRSIALATSVEPVKQTPDIRWSAVSGAPTDGPSPGRSWITSSGTPASRSSATARAAISGVCSAGFAITELPVTSAAAICPVKIASGKFQGEMQTIAPRASVPASAAGASDA